MHPDCVLPYGGGPNRRYALYGGKTREDVPSAETKVGFGAYTGTTTFEDVRTKGSRPDFPPTPFFGMR
jgi:hypothetical protein